MSKGSDLGPDQVTDPERWYRILLEPDSSCILFTSSCQRADCTFSFCNHKCPFLFCITYLLYVFPTYRLPPGLCVLKLYMYSYVLMYSRILFLFTPFMFLLLRFELNRSLLYPLLTGFDCQYLIPLASYLSPSSFPLCNFYTFLRS
jgi:hypothetical protein